MNDQVHRGQWMMSCLRALSALSLSLSVSILLMVSGAAHASGPIALDNATVMKYLLPGKDQLVIHLPEGTYQVSETLKLPSNTVLEGEGSSTVLQAHAPFRGQRFITNADAGLGNSNITVRSIAVQFGIPVFAGDTPGILRFERVKGLNLSDVTMDLDTAYFGIDLASEVRDALIAGCSIKNKGEGGSIMVRNSNPDPSHATSNITIRGNKLESSTQDEPLAVFGWMGKVENVLIINNTIKANGASFGISVFGIDQKGHTGTLSKVKVADNTVNGGKTGGITVKGGANDVELTGNKISRAGGDGIFIHAGGGNLPEASHIGIYRNDVSDSGRHCIFAGGNDISIDGNTLTNCKQCGVYVGGKVRIVRNRIAKANPGILFDTDMDGVVDSNVLVDSGGINTLGKGKVIRSNNIMR